MKRRRRALLLILILLLWLWCVLVLLVLLLLLRVLAAAAKRAQEAGERRQTRLLLLSLVLRWHHGLLLDKIRVDAREHGGRRRHASELVHLLIALACLRRDPARVGK